MISFIIEIMLYMTIFILQLVRLGFRETDLGGSLVVVLFLLFDFVQEACTCLHGRVFLKNLLALGVLG